MQDEEEKQAGPRENTEKLAQKYSDFSFKLLENKKNFFIKGANKSIILRIVAAILYDFVDIIK